MPTNVGNVRYLNNFFSDIGMLYSVIERQNSYIHIVLHSLFSTICKVFVYVVVWCNFEQWKRRL